MIFADDETIEILVELVLYHDDATFTLYSFAAFSNDQFLDDDDIAPGYLNTKYECLRPTPLKPYHNRKLVALLHLLERQREVNMEERNALSYRHAIAAIKVHLFVFVYE